jgi:exonuclease SbcD
VHVFGHRKAQSFHHDPSRTTLHGRSYRDRDPGENLAATYPAAVAGRFNIGVRHTALTGGRPPHAPYSPCSPADLAGKSYDYWALGHVHNFEVVSREPYIVFPGNIQGRSIRETGPKGAALISVEDGRISGLKLIELDAVRWATIKVDISQVKTEHDLRVAIRTSLQDAITQNDSKPLIARVTLNGQIAGDALPVHSETIREDIRAIAVGLSDDLWIEKVRVGVTRLGNNAEKAAQSGDIASLLETGLSDPILRQALAADFSDFVSRIPPDLGDESSSLSSVRDGHFDQVLTDAAAALRSRLLKQAT